jgi:hypothetical protein
MGYGSRPVSDILGRYDDPMPIVQKMGAIFF